MIQQLLSMALIVCLTSPCRAQSEARGAEGAEELSGVLAGIVYYTRWPGSPTPLRVCVDARDELATDAGTRRIADELAVLGPNGISIEGRRLDDGPSSVLDCQAIYVGDVSAATWKGLLKDLVSRPVLAIGYGEEFCSRGGQFCLDRAAGGLRIRANLDSISRSGLRVNPQLLRLTQRHTEATR